jgi:hypothetical protein
MLAVILPCATGLNIFLGSYRRRRAQHRDQFNLLAEDWHHDTFLVQLALFEVSF